MRCSAPPAEPTHHVLPLVREQHAVKRALPAKTATKRRRPVQAVQKGNSSPKENAGPQTAEELIPLEDEEVLARY